MKKKIAVLIVTTISFLFSGCIEVDFLVKVNSDGSGTIHEKLLLSGEMIDMMNSFMMMGDDTSGTGFDIFNEEELMNEAAEYGPGVEFVSGEKLSDGRREGYSAVYKFDNINQIKLKEDVTDKVPAGMTAESEEEGDYVTFVFREGDPSELTINLPPKDEEDSDFDLGLGDPDEMSGEEDSEMTEQIKQMMREFGFSIRLEVNGDIESTDAIHVDGNQITLLEMNFGKLMDMPEKFEELKTKEPKNFEEVQEFLKDIPGFKFELKDKVNIKFN